MIKQPIGFKYNTITTSVNKTPDTNLYNLCKYYLECISYENSNGISSFLTSKYSPPYVEISGLAKEFLNTPETLQYINKNKKKTLFVGYPILISNFKGKDGKNYCKQYPIFIFHTVKESGQLEIDSMPSINTEAIKRLITTNDNEALYEKIKIEKELFDLDNEYRYDFSDICANLQNKYYWNWKETINPSSLNNNIPLVNLTEDGIYNKAILISTDRKNIYTQGLESELDYLSELSTEDIKGSALFDWLYENNQGSVNNIKEILEVAPLNSEQRQAVNKGLNSKTTIVTGPPGTGKSQVVTDLLINMAYNGKSVLFSSKNNKAVDIVYERVNSLANRPVMIRVGSINYSKMLSELVENLLSSFQSEVNSEEFKYQNIRYKQIIDHKKSLYEEKNNIINQRNRVDYLEREILQIEPNILENMKKTSSNKIQLIQEKYSLSKKLFLNTFKSNHNYITKLLWKWKREEFENNFINCIKELNTLIIPFDIKFDEIIDANIIKNQSLKMDKLFENFKLLNDYEASISTLNNLPSTCDIDYKIAKEDENLQKLSTKLWRNWLLVHGTSIPSEDRKAMSDFVTALKLASQDDVINDTILQKKFKTLQDKLTKYFPCWSVTSLSVKSRIPFQKCIFDLLIIDEASQCDIASILPLLYRAKRTIIIGDPKQLTHITTIPTKKDSDLINKYDIPYSWSYTSSSLYNLGSGLVDSNQIIHLRDHYRSCADIIEYSNQQFYGEKLRIATYYNKLRVPNNYSPGIRWTNISGTTVRPQSGSCYNKEEAEEVIKEIKKLILNDYAGTIGVITPFRAQADLINKMIDNDSTISNNILKYDLLVDTVHKFQGDERDVIIFSSTISNECKSTAIDFLKENGNLFNVAITRARAVLIVIGDINMCLNADVPYLKSFVNYYKKLLTTSNNTSIIPKYGETREYPDIENDSIIVSDWEKILYTALFDAGIKTIPQYSEDKYSLDLAIIYGTNKLDIEVDGEMYHKMWNGELAYIDQLRNQRLFELGWDVKRFWVYQVRDNIDKCIEQIKEWVEKNKPENN